MQRPSSAKKVRPSGARGVNSLGGRNALSSGRSSSLSRLSGASQGRFSEGGRTQSKDSRAVTDKTFLFECAQKILKFCIDNEYKTTHLSAKALVTPSLKDFFGIFEFLCCMIKGSFKYTSKPEDEIPKMVKLLRYPFTINRSMLLGLGSRQTWGCLLGLLVWMIDFIQLCYEANIRTYMEGPEEEFSGEFNEILLDGVAESYKYFVQTGETDDTRDADLYDKFVQTYMKQGNLDQLQDTHQRLSAQHEELKRKHDDVLLHERNLDRTAIDIERLEQYLVQMDSYLLASKEKCNNFGMQIKSIEEEIKPLRLERDELQGVINQQTAEANQYKLAVAKREVAKERYESAVAMVARLENAVTDREVKSCNAWNTNQKLVKEHEAINSNTKTIVKLFKDYELSCNVISQLTKMSSECNPSDFITNLDQHLMQVKNLLGLLEDRNLEISNSVMSAERALSELKEYYKGIEIQDNSIQASLDAEKVKDARCEAEYQEELNKMEQVLKEMEMKKEMKQFEDTKYLAAEKKRVQVLEAQLAEWERKIPEYEKECNLVLKKTCSRINAHYEQRTKILAECFAETKRELESMISDDLEK